MACGACGGGGGSGPSVEYQVRVAGEVQPVTFSTTVEAHMWIAANVKGQTATVRAVPKKTV